MARRLLGGAAALVFVFLYAPILVVIVYAFNGGRETLVWDGFSTKWFGEALHDDGGHGCPPQLAHHRRRQRRRRLHSRDDAGARTAEDVEAGSGCRSRRS